MIRWLIPAMVSTVLCWGVLASHSSWALLNDEAAPADSVVTAEYRGNKICRVCHSKVFKSWEATAHASALSNLAVADSVAVKAMSKKLGIPVHGSAAETGDCVKCHVVGYGLPGGYPGADSTSRFHLGSVGCESCHGPGSLHVTAKEGEHKSTIQRAVPEKLCTGCHTPKTSPGFKFDAYSKTGVHALAR